MSLQTRLTDLATALGTDIKALRNRNNLPSYAPSSLKNAFDPKNHFYNLKSTNSKHAHAGIVRAQNGGRMNILAFGDSQFIGFDGTDTREWRSIPSSIARYIAQSLAVPEAGGMVAIGASPAATFLDRYTSTGTVTIASGYATMSAGATVTFKSRNTGTSAEVYYSDQSSSFTVNIDGTGPVTVTPTGTTAAKRYVVTGLANTTHTVVVTANSNWTFLEFVGVMAAAGVKVDNISWGGSRAATGGPTLAWLDTSSTSGIQQARKNAFDLQTIVPDLVLVSLGGNDVGNGGVTGDAFATSMATLRAWYPNSDFCFVLSMGLTTITQATWDAFCGRMYTMCDDLDIPMIDIRDRAGFASEAITLGYVGADGYHEVQGAMLDWARIIASGYLSYAVKTQRDVLVLPVGATVPDGTPAGTVIVRT